MKKVLIIEDERISAIRLEKLIREIDDTIEVEGPLVSVSEVVEHLHRHNDYDLIFADIRLSDGDVFCLSRNHARLFCHLYDGLR